MKRNYISSLSELLIPVNDDEFDKKIKYGPNILSHLIYKLSKELTFSGIPDDTKLIYAIAKASGTEHLCHCDIKELAIKYQTSFLESLYHITLEFFLQGFDSRLNTIKKRLEDGVSHFKVRLGKESLLTIKQALDSLAHPNSSTLSNGLIKLDVAISLLTEELKVSDGSAIWTDTYGRSTINHPTRSIIDSIFTLIPKYSEIEIGRSKDMRVKMVTNVRIISSLTYLLTLLTSDITGHFNPADNKPYSWVRNSIDRVVNNVFDIGIYLSPELAIVLSMVNGRIALPCIKFIDSLSDVPSNTVNYSDTAKEFLDSLYYLFR